MPHDTILFFEDYADEVEQALTPASKMSYGDFVAYHYARYLGRELGQAPPEAPLESAAYVDGGRWVWNCPACTSGNLVSRDNLVTVCPRCGSDDSWIRVRLPAPPMLQAITSELLKMPGHRLFAPVRTWFPAWTLDYLQERTALALQKVRSGIRYPTSLSILIPRTWAVGEILTAANMNTWIREFQRQVAGDDGVTEFRHSIAPASFTTAQRNVISNPPDGSILWNSTVDRMEHYGEGTFRSSHNPFISDDIEFTQAGSNSDQDIELTHDLGYLPINMIVSLYNTGSTAFNGLQSGAYLFYPQRRALPNEPPYIRFSDNDNTTVRYRVFGNNSDPIAVRFPNGTELFMRGLTASNSFSTHRANDVIKGRIMIM